MDDSSSEHLPRILCLHGGGTSATIFKIQLRRLQWALSPYFKFVFVSAPFESGPGPGVMPVFADCGPYYRWMAPEGSDQAPGQIKVRELLSEVIRDDGGDFVGVLGFSQGARMAAGLLADQEEVGGKEFGMPRWEFGVLLCGSYPPSSLSASKKPVGRKVENADHHGEIRQPQEDEVIHVPTVHVRGLSDQHLEKGRRLSMFFDNKTEFEFDMGHHLPGAAGDVTSPKEATKQIADAILHQYGLKASAGNGTLDTPSSLLNGGHA